MKILIIVILLFSHLIGINGESKISHSQTCEDSIKVFLEDWKRDSLGCLHLRTFKKANFLIDKLELNKSSAKEIIELLGHPNIDTLIKSTIRYRYDLLLICIPQNKPLDDADVCWIEFFISSKDSIVYSIQHGCT